MRIGIIGLGFMGGTHLDAFSKMEGVEVAAVCTANPQAFSGAFRPTGGNLNRETAVHDFSAVHKCSDWRELVADADLDAVDICLPTDLHASVAIAALQDGKHVLCEKPLALTGADCDSITAEAKKQNRVLMAGQVLRFWPEYMYLERFVKSREYGGIRSATFVRRCGLPDWSRWLPDENRSGGAVLDLLIHDIDQALWVFGTPDRIAAKRLGSDDAIAATLIYPGGPEVRIQGGWFAPGSALSMTFQARAERAELEFTPQGLYLSNQAGQRKPIPATGDDAYAAELAYFVQCCRTNTQPERCMPHDSCRAVKLALLLKQSRAQGGKQLKCVL
ncbi:MAG: Gfo/Idh/MocA family protein [Bryobacteraceae bacterium]